MSELVNFRKTLMELEEFLGIPIENHRDRAGIIKAFEFTFEQSWKAIQKFAVEQGSQVASPKAAFTFAMNNQWIPFQEEELWLQIIIDRSLASHTYQEELAIKVVQKIQTRYLNAFQQLLVNLEQV